MASSPAGAASAHTLQPTTVSRQPIFESDLKLYGYELFFDSQAPGPGTANDRVNPPLLIESAREQVGGIVGQSRAFINLTKDVILSGCCDRLPAAQVVLEILEDVPPEAKVIAELKRLSKLGYRIALDDFVYAPSQIPFIDLAHIIKIDLLATRGPRLLELIRVLLPFDVRLLAEKIETEQDLQLARELGFDYFQGFFLARPVRET
jgi:EAL and modified HD-GYP domain-containing signal transduction protein